MTSSDSDHILSSGFEIHPHLEERFTSLPTLSEDDKELEQCGCWSEQFQVNIRILISFSLIFFSSDNESAIIPSSVPLPMQSS